jgi:hypothetical protein
VLFGQDFHDRGTPLVVEILDLVTEPFELFGIGLHRGPMQENFLPVETSRRGVRITEIKRVLDQQNPAPAREGRMALKQLMRKDERDRPAHASEQFEGREATVDLQHLTGHEA